MSKMGEDQLKGGAADMHSNDVMLAQHVRCLVPRAFSRALPQGMTMELVFLGTGSAYPSPHRGASCTILRTEAEGCWMFDCGEGSQIQLMRSSVRPSKINRIFITHLHGDHLFGLPGLLCTVSQNCSEDMVIDLYGPFGLRRYLRTALCLSRSILGLKYRVHELLTDQPPSELATDRMKNWSPEHEADGPVHPNEIVGENIRPNEQGIWELFKSAFFTVCAGFLSHRIACFGFTVTENDLPGKLCVDKLKSLGIPSGPLYGRLKRGEEIVTSTGIVVKPDDVLGPPRPGRRIVILGDTCDSSGIASISLCADVLVHEATNENSHHAKCVENGHSTPAMAGQFASLVNCRNLILTHFSQRYKQSGSELQPGEESVDKLVEEAHEVFTGSVYAADDLWTFSIPLHQT